MALPVACNFFGIYLAFCFLLNGENGLVWIVIGPGWRIGISTHQESLAKEGTEQIVGLIVNILIRLILVWNENPQKTNSLKRDSAFFSLFESKCTDHVTGLIG